MNNISFTSIVKNGKKRVVLMDGTNSLLALEIQESRGLKFDTQPGSVKKNPISLNELMHNKICFL